MSDPEATAETLSNTEKIAQQATELSAQLLAFARLLRERHSEPEQDDNG